MNQSPPLSEAPPRRAAKDPLYSGLTRVFHLELTSRCNLRCVYCAMSQPAYKGMDMDLARLPALLDEMKLRRPAEILANGHGETTLLPGWERHCLSLKASGARLRMITNFARPLRAEEAAAFARFDGLEVSVDTADPALLRRLRRGDDLRSILSNMLAVRRAAEAIGLPGPAFTWSCVVSDKNAALIPDLARLAVRAGVVCLNFCNLTQYPDVPGAETVRHISTLEGEALEAAVKGLLGGVRLARGNGLNVYLQDGLLDSVDARLSGAGPARELKGKATRFAGGKPAGCTRACRDPWNFALIKADGSVSPCCWHRPVGNISAGSLDDILEGQVMRDLRSSLLAGRPDEDCSDCPARGWTPLETPGTVPA